MYETLKSEHNGVEQDDFSATNLHFKDVHTCSHFFEKVGIRVQCTKCGIGYFDDPLEPFPIDEINKFYKDPKNQEYFKNNTP